jgi:hypothetical protein
VQDRSKSASGRLPPGQTLRTSLYRWPIQVGTRAGENRGMPKSCCRCGVEPFTPALAPGIGSLGSSRDFSLSNVTYPTDNPAKTSEHDFPGNEMAQAEGERGRPWKIPSIAAAGALVSPWATTGTDGAK